MKTIIKKLFIVFIFILPALLIIYLKYINKVEMKVVSFSVMDTVLTVKYYNTNDINVVDLKNKINSILHEIDVYDKESLLYKINLQPINTEIKVPFDIYHLLNISKKISQNTNYMFDVTLGKITSLWKKNIKNNKLENTELIGSYLKDCYKGNFEIYIKNNKYFLVKKSDFHFDLSSYGKGYIVDIIKDFLKNNKIKYFLIDGGGDIYCNNTHYNGRAWIIGLQNPNNGAAILDRLIIRNRAIATSGHYERFFIYKGRRYHHIIDPRTGYPSNYCSSVTIISDECVLADAYATAIFNLPAATGIEVINKIADIEGIIISDNDKKYYSENVKTYIQ